MNQLIKASPLFTFFCILWFIPLIYNNTDNHIWIFVAGTILGTLCLLLIKNKILSYLTAFISIVIPIVFNFENIFLILPAAVLLFYFVCLQKKAASSKTVFSDKAKNKKMQSNISHKSVKKTSLEIYAGSAVSLAVSTIICVCMFIIKLTRQNATFTEKYKLSQMILFGLFFFFAALVAICLFRESEIKKETNKNGFSDTDILKLKSLYISSFFCFIQSLFSFYVSNSHFTAGYERAFFFPWFIYFFLIVFFNDPVAETLINKGKMFLKVTSTKYFS